MSDTETNSPEVEKILKDFQEGKIGPETCSRLLAIRCVVEALDYSEEQAREVERELEMEFGK